MRRYKAEERDVLLEHDYFVPFLRMVSGGVRVVLSVESWREASA
jgi:hypothetical protein